MAFKSEKEKNKVIDNLDYKTKKEQIQKVNMVKYEPGVFDINKYKKYLKAIDDDNVQEVFPDESIFELERMRKVFEQEKD
tara:strand:- start:827 stop:1066 length:240 start_codon:yes stop_codon:yes gene_type:complete